jgi:hypothetical protein
MPYKNPEDKKQWEREHREIRNARRRQSRLERQTDDFVQQTTPDPISQQKSKNGWKMLVALAVAVGIALISAFVGVKLPNSGRAS